MRLTSIVLLAGFLAGCRPSDPGVTCQLAEMTTVYQTGQDRIVFAYDDGGRLVSSDFSYTPTAPNGNPPYSYSINYYYSTDHNPDSILSSLNPHGTRHIAYDHLRRPVFVRSAAGDTVKLEYNDSGQLRRCLFREPYLPARWDTIQYWYPNSITRNYDSTVTTNLVYQRIHKSFTYDDHENPFTGFPFGFEFGGTDNNIKRVQSVYATGGIHVREFTYGYDTSGRVVTRSDIFQGTQTTLRFDYTCP